LALAAIFNGTNFKCNVENHPSTVYAHFDLIWSSAYWENER